MGYTTFFAGKFNINPSLDNKHQKYLHKFAKTRRVKRDGRKVRKYPDPERKAVGLTPGRDGQYFVGDISTGRLFPDGRPDDAGPDTSDSIKNSNKPPADQPGLWCKWTVNNDGSALVWDRGEKFYRYREWLQYIIENFLKQWGYTVNGTMVYIGERADDNGELVVKNNSLVDDRSLGTAIRYKKQAEYEGGVQIWEDGTHDEKIRPPKLMRPNKKVTQQEAVWLDAPALDTINNREKVIELVYSMTDFITFPDAPDEAFVDSGTIYGYNYHPKKNWEEIPVIATPIQESERTKQQESLITAHKL